MQWLQLRRDGGSTPIRLQLDRATTIRRPTSRLWTSLCAGCFTEA